jgi:hypothetical protein
LDINDRKEKKMLKKISKIFNSLYKCNYTNGTTIEYGNYYTIKIYGINKRISKIDFGNYIYNLKIDVIYIKWITESTITIIIKKI